MGCLCSVKHQLKICTERDENNESMSAHSVLISIKHLICEGFWLQSLSASTRTASDRLKPSHFATSMLSVAAQMRAHTRRAASCSSLSSSTLAKYGWKTKYASHLCCEIPHDWVQIFFNVRRVLVCGTSFSAPATALAGQEPTGEGVV